ncbi:MAG: YybH family protein [Betaproteobacteria bacterium]
MPIKPCARDEPPPALPPSAEAAETAVYAAFEAGDLEAMMLLWRDDPTVVCVHPGGERHVGLAQVRESWQRIFAGSGQLRFRVAQCVGTNMPDLAIRCVIEHIGLRGVRGSVAVVATNVFRRGPEGWQLWMHHASPQPASSPAGAGEESDPSGTDTPPRGDPERTLH